MFKKRKEYRKDPHSYKDSDDEKKRKKNEKRINHNEKENKNHNSDKMSSDYKPDSAFKYFNSGTENNNNKLLDLKHENVPIELDDFNHHHSRHFHTKSREKRGNKVDFCDEFRNSFDFSGSSSYNLRKRKKSRSFDELNNRIKKYFFDSSVMMFEKKKKKEEKNKNVLVDYLDIMNEKRKEYNEQKTERKKKRRKRKSRNEEEDGMEKEKYIKNYNKKHKNHNHKYKIRHKDMNYSDERSEKEKRKLNSWDEHYGKELKVDKFRYEDVKEINDDFDMNELKKQNAQQQKGNEMENVSKEITGEGPSLDLTHSSVLDYIISSDEQTRNSKNIFCEEECSSKIITNVNKLQQNSSDEISKFESPSLELTNSSMMDVVIPSKYISYKQLLIERKAQEKETVKDSEGKGCIFVICLSVLIFFFF
jgi:hypothetical protein